MGRNTFVNVPHVAHTSLPLFEFASIFRSKLLAPLANCFLGDRDVALAEQFFHFTEAEAEAMAKPGGMADEL